MIQKVVTFIVLLSPFVNNYSYGADIPKIKLESVLQNTANNYLPKLENVLKKVIKDIKNINPKTEQNMLFAFPNLIQLYAKAYNYFSKALNKIVSDESQILNGKHPSKDIKIPTSYVKICFHALKETVTTTEDIARLLVTTKLIVNNITSAYKSNVQNSNGDIEVPNNTGTQLNMYLSELVYLNDKTSKTLFHAVREVRASQGENNGHSMTTGGQLIVGFIEEIAEYLGQLTEKIANDVKPITETIKIQQMSNDYQKINLSQIVYAGYQTCLSSTKSFKDVVMQGQQLASLIPYIKFL